MKKIAVAITGASGSLYAKVLLEKLSRMKEQLAELSIVMTDNAKQVWQTEIGNSNYDAFPARYFTTKDFMAPFASGSAGYDGIIIAPCSMGTLGRISAGISNDLVILDYNIPEISGADLLAYLNHHPRFQLTTKLVWSTSDSPLYENSCLKLGAHAYLVKPSSFSGISQIARRILSYLPQAA